MTTILGRYPHFILVLALAVAAAGLGCGSDNPADSGGFGEVNVLVGGGSWEEVAMLSRTTAPVPAEDIESFLLDVDRIVLNAKADDDTSDTGDPEDPEEPEDPAEIFAAADSDSADGDSSGMVVIFDAEEQPEVDNEIDLIDLGNLSDIISSSGVPAGHYSQIRLEIANPRLRLVGEEPGEYLTNIELTANGRLFALVDLEIAERETVNLMLLLNRIHLVQKGNGDFVLTPQLGVEVVQDL